MKKLVVYQVWNKEDHKVVFLDHKPTVVELFTISLNHHWIGLFDSEESQHYFIKSLDVKKINIPANEYQIRNLYAKENKKS